VSVRWRSRIQAPPPASAPRARAIGRHDGATQVGHPAKPRGLMLWGRCRCGSPARDSASGRSSAVVGAISCRSSRTQGSSDLCAGQRQPPIDRSPSRIATTWSHVADRFTPRAQVSRAAFAIRHTEQRDITFTLVCG